MPFAEPDSPDQFKVADHVGSLALIAVNGHHPGFPTANGLRDVIRAEIVLIDGPTAGQRYADGMFFQQRLVPQLRSNLGKTVLGRFALGQAKAGQNPPYILDKPTPDDVEIANKWVAANGDVEAHVISEPPQIPEQRQPAEDGTQWRMQQHQQQYGQPGSGSYGRPPQQNYSANANVGQRVSYTAASGDQPPF